MEFQHPFTAVFAGPTGSGKTVFVKKLLQHIHKMIQPTPNRIIYCYSEWQSAFTEMLKDNPRIQFSNGLISIDELAPYDKNLIILDDLMDECKDSTEISKLFTKGSHHRNLSVILLIQNLFVQGKTMRTISLNAHYMVIFKNPEINRKSVI